MKNKLLFAMSLLASTEALAASEQKAEALASPRMNHKLGAFLGIGNPNPGILSLNAGYNLIDAARVEVGYADLSIGNSSASVYGAGVRAMLPGWALSPSAGVHYAYVAYDGNGLTLGGFKESGSHVYLSAGVDYQAKSGFYSGLGYNYSLRSGIGGAGYLQMGWFFDLAI